MTGPLMENACPVDRQAVSWVRDPRRWAFAGVGVASAGMGWLGVFVPGLPTTIFLIIASYCFARSCPWLEDRLLRIPLFAPYMKVLDEGRGMSRKAAASALVSMWSCVAVSLTILYAAGRLAPWVAALIVFLALVGTASILLYARRPQAA
ncbi:MAG: YbaN family protein [Vicinamibacterales bacterium]